MIDLNSGSGPLLGPYKSHPLDVAEPVNAAIDAGLEAKAAQEPARTYLGASQLGDPCLRKLVYHYRSTSKKQPEGRMRRIWERGHWAEARIITWLRGAGLTVIDRDTNGEQIRFKQADGRISGSCDGIVTAGPISLPYPLLLELKCLNHKSWNDLRRNGLTKSKAIYYSQIHLYMGYLGLNNCLFGAENADTEELWWHVISFDIAEAQRVSDRGVEIILHGGSENPLPDRIAHARDFYLCRMCEYADTCWDEQQ